jgi:hypothetical protein
MIKAANNVFLDVNDATIIIEEVTTPTFFYRKFSKSVPMLINQLFSLNILLSLLRNGYIYCNRARRLDSDFTFRVSDSKK